MAEAINNAVTQLRDLFRSMTPGARVTAGLLLAAVVVSLGYLFVGGGGSPDDYLFGGVPLGSAEVNKIQVALLAAQINADVSGNRIRVPSTQKSAAMQAIQAADALPRNIDEIMAKALDAGSLWEGSAKTKQRIEDARAQRASMKLRQFTWIEDAYVSYDSRKGRGLQRDDLVTASVTIKPMPGESLTGLREEEVKKFVAGDYAGMTPEKVVVADVSRTSGSGGNHALELIAVSKSPYLKEKKIYEELWQERIRGALQYIPNLRVAVGVELNKQLNSRTYNHRPDAKGTARHTESLNESTTTTTAATAGRPGTYANGPEGTAQQPQSTPTTQSQKTSEREIANNVVGYTVEERQEDGLTPANVQATIGVPMDWIVQVWKSRRKRESADPNEELPSPTPEELKQLTEEQRTQIQNDVENLLPPVPEGQNPYPRVVVSFYETPELTPPSEPALTESGLTWVAANWSTLAMLALALVSLVVLRSLVRSIAVSESPAAEPRTLQVDVPPQQEEDVENEEPDRPKLRLNKGPTLKDDLVQLVREDPDTAATILRSWISTAA